MFYISFEEFTAESGIRETNRLDELENKNSLKIGDNLRRKKVNGNNNSTSCVIFEQTMLFNLHTVVRIRQWAW